MNLVERVLSMLRGEGSAAAPAATSHRTREGAALPQILKGRVTHVGSSFFKVHLPSGSIGQVGGFHVPHGKKDVPSHYEEGDDVEVVVLGPSERKPGEKVCSQVLVSEVQRRQDLARLSVGDEVEAEVTRMAAKGFHVAFGRADGVVTHDPQARSRPGAPMPIPGQRVRIRIDRIDMPAMLPAIPPKQLHSGFRASLCDVQSDGAEVAWDVGAVACSLQWQLRLPREVDAICRWCLGRFVAGADRATLVVETGLPATSVDAIAELLIEHGLVESGSLQPTKQGHSLLAAIGKVEAQQLRQPVRFLFASAMPRNAQFLQADVAPAARPAGCPPALQDPVAEYRLRVDPSAVVNDLRDMLPQACADLSLDLLQDRWLRMTLRVERHPVPLTLRVPASFLTEALHRHFISAEQDPPPRALRLQSCARVLLLVRLRVTLAAHGTEAQREEEVFLEPASESLWRCDMARNVKMSSVPASDFPPLPPDLARRLGTDGRLADVQIMDWQRVKLRGPRSSAIS